MRLVAVLAVSAVTLAAQTGGQPSGPLSTTADGSGLVIVNTSPVGFVVFVAHRAGAGRFVAGDVLEVAPGTTRVAGLAGTTARMELAHPLAWTAPLQKDPPCTSAKFVDLASIAAGVDALERLRVTNTPEARAELAAQSRIAALEYESYADITAFERHNAVERLSLERSYAADPVGTSRAVAVQDQRDMFNSVMTMATVNAATTETYLSQLESQATLLEGPAANAKIARGDISADIRAMEIEARESRRFVDGLARRAAASPVPSGIPVVVGAARSCSFAPRLREYVDITLEPGFNATSVVAELSFDKGGSHKTVLTRFRGSDVWRGLVIWPPDAKTARIALLLPKKLQVKTRLDTGRRSLKEIAATADKRLAAVEKSYKEAKAKAQGRDHREAIIIR